MPQQGTPAFVKYRVLNQNTGAVVVPDLPHLHRSDWTVRALQRGLPGTTTMGDFTIALPGPASDLFRRYKPIYDLLAKGQKIEGYLGDVVTGSPRFSGVITGIRKRLAGDWEITGVDTLWWLQQSQMYPGETIGPGTTDGLVAVFPNTREVVFDGQPNTPGGTWSSTNADPQMGLPAVYTSQTASNNTYLTTSVWNSVNEYNLPSGNTLARASSITAWGTIVGGTDTASSGQAGVVWLWDAASTTGYMARAVQYQTAANSQLWSVDVQIYSVSGGTYTQLATVTGVFASMPTARLPFQITVNLSNFNYPSGPQHIFNVFLNGKKTGCQVGIAHGSLVRTSGNIGYWAYMNAGGSPAVYFNNLRFDSRTGQKTLNPFPTTWGTDRFQAGQITTGSASIGQFNTDGLTHLDMWLLAATLDGFDIRKTPQAGYKSDQIDYGPNLGNDLSSSIVFEEGVNVTADGTEVAPVADLLSTAARVNAIPNSTSGGDSGGSVTWVTPGNGEGVGGNPANGGDIVLTDTVADVGTPVAGLLLGYARILANRKASGTFAIQVNVIRTADTADRFRELDYVHLHLPTLGIFHQKVQVIGYKFIEGSPTMLVYLSEFPDRSLVQAQLQRLVRAQDFMSGSYAAR